MSKTQTISQAILIYLNTLHVQYSPQTILAYAQALRLFEHVTQEEHHINTDSVSIHEMDVTWAHTYIHHLQNTHSIETEHLYTRALLSFWQQTQINRQDADILASYIATHRRPKQHHIPDLPFDIIETILNYATGFTFTTPISHTKQPTNREQLRLQRDKAFLLTLAHTGLRVSEICNLRKQHIDLTQKTLTLTEDRCILPIPSNVSAAINSYLVNRKTLDDTQRLFGPDHLPIFARHDKKAGKKILPISRWTAANIVDYWVNQALPPDILDKLHQQDCSISPQTFRHYFVITILKQTGNLNKTQALARHIDTSTTRRYLRFADSDVDSTNT